MPRPAATGKQTADVATSPTSNLKPECLDLALFPERIDLARGQAPSAGAPGRGSRGSLPRRVGKAAVAAFSKYRRVLAATKQAGISTELPVSADAT